MDDPWHVAPDAARRTGHPARPSAARHRACNARGSVDAAIDMNTARFFGDLANDHDCGGIADDGAEGARIAAAFDGSRF